MISSLGYLGISTPSYGEWEKFGPEVLGMQLAPQGADGAVRLRLDDAAYRLALHPGEVDDIAYVGWEVSGEAAAHEVATAAESCGLEVHRSTDELEAERAVRGLLWFIDPFGLRHELAWGRVTYPSSFLPGRAMSGFKTGEQGLGHVVFFVPDLAAADSFFRDVMGFHLSDRIVEGPIDARFYHVNGRHHTLALAEAPFVGLQHLMIETNSLDDVGFAQDICEQNGVQVTMTLGRHTNDLMTSFYLRTPSSFDIEYGWGGLEVDDLWIPKTFNKMSMWGHRRPPAAADLAPGLIRPSSDA